MRRAADLTAESVTVDYRRPGATVRVLDRVSFRVRPGEFVSIVGPSGCGKSTLLKTLAGLNRAGEGTVRVGGQAIDGPHPTIMYLFQDYAKSLFPWKTVEGNVLFGLRHGNSPQAKGSSEEAERCRSFIADVGLEGFESSHLWELSGGMQQRVAVARALASEPTILLMDEPFGSVDALTRQSLQDLLLGIWHRTQISIVFVTHDIEEAVYLADRVVVLGPRPTQVAEELDIGLPRPRSQLTTRRSARFLDHRDHLFRRIVGDPADLADRQAT